MSDPITATAPIEHLRGDAKKARLAAFAQLNLRTPEDIRKFIRDQEAACAARTSLYGVD
jgi:hypothetical protein